MTIDQLYYFRKLAELQHFSKAAAELYISQPSLSYSIKNLEKELGAPLFKKNGRNVVLTKYGKEFYNYVAEVLALLEEGISAVKQSIEIDSGKISIGALPISPANLIAKNIRSFLNKNSDVTFDIFTCIDNSDIINGVLDGVYDIGLCYKFSREKDLVYIPVLKRDFVVITKYGHELSQKGSLTISDLQDIPLITYRESNPLGLFIRNQFKNENINPNIIFSFDEEITISEMVAHDLGIAILIKLPLLQHYLSLIPLKINAEPPTLYLIYHKESDHAKIIRRFVRHIMEENKL